MLTSNNKIVCTEKYYSKHKQDLIAEIKTRFANDIRDEKKLVKWNGIVTDDFTYETDLAFFTANPQQLSKKRNTYHFHPTLNKSRGEAHILGLDNVFYFTFRTGNTAKEMIEMFGDEAVKTNAQGNWVVTLQGNIRAGLKKGETQEQMQVRLGDAKMGISTKGATIDPTQAYQAQFLAATPEAQVAMIKELQKRAAELRKG